MKKASLLSIALMLCLSVFLTACGNSTSSTNQGGNTTNTGKNTGTKAGNNGNNTSANSNIKGKITVITQRTDLTNDGTFDKYAKAFEKKYPGTNVKFQALTNYAPDMKVRVTNGEMGDVLMVPTSISPSDYPKYLEALPDSMFKDIYFPDQDAYKGKRYGIATGVNTLGIVYNKNAFKKAGITKVPQTLDDFYADCKKLKNAGIIPLYMNYGAQWPLGDWADGFVAAVAGNANYVNTMVNEDAPFQVNNPWGKLITIARTLVKDKYVEPDLATNNWEASKGQVAAGQAAMYFLGNWVIPQVESAGAKASDIGFFPMPYNNSGKLNTLLGPDYMMAVAKNSKNKATAEAWVNFFVRDSGYAQSQGFIPPVKSQQPSMPQLQEFKSYKPNMIQGAPLDSKALDIFNKAQIGIGTGDYVQKWIKADDLKKTFDTYNAKWKAAKDAVTSAS